MSNTTTSARLLPLKLDEPTFKAIIWAFTAFALPFVPFRLFVRWRVFRKLFIDDVLVVLAYCFLLAYAILWQNYADDLYTVFNVAAGLAQPDAHFQDHFGRYLKADVETNIMYTFCLWSIKLAFLLFFKRLGRNVRCQKIIWWIVFIYTISAFIIWYAISPWRCMANTSEASEAICDELATARASQLALKLQTAMDITSDILIILVPISLLWNVQIPLRTKLRLYSIFSITTLVIIASVVRVIVVSATALPDQSWFFPWSAIEMSTAIIVACLASYRALFTPSTISKRLPNHHAQQRDDPERQQLRRFSLHNIRRSSASLSATINISTPLATFNPALGQTSAFVHAKNSVQEDQSSVNQAYRLPATASEKSSATPEDGHVYIRSEYSVYSETITPLRT